MIHDTADDRVSRRALASIGILAFCMVCSHADRQLTSIMAVPIRAHFALDHSQMALLGGLAFALLYGFAGIPAGLAADRYPRRNIIIGAVLFWSLCTGLCGVATSYSVLFLARAGVGIGEAALLPCAFSLIHNLVPPARRGMAFGLFGLGIPVGMALGLAAGGVLNDFFAADPSRLGFLGNYEPWQKTFLLLALLGVPAALSLLLLEEPERRAPAAATEPVAKPLKRATIIFFFVAIALSGIAVQGINFWTPSSLTHRFGLTLGEVGVRLGLITIVAGTIGMTVIGRITDHQERRHGPTGVAITLVWCYAGFAVAAVLIGFGTFPVVWVGAGLFYAIGLGFTTAASAFVLHLGGTTRSGLYAAIYGLVINLAGFGVGPLAYGMMMDRSGVSEGSAIAIATLVVAPLAAIAIGAVIFLNRTTGKATLSRLPSL